MKKINTYIFEKLRINKDIASPYITLENFIKSINEEFNIKLT